VGTSPLVAALVARQTPRMLACARGPKEQSRAHPPTSLFEMEQEDKTLELASILSGLVHLDRPYDEPGLLLGTSAFTANGWAGSFYPVE
jgi:hypothetical protein